MSLISRAARNFGRVYAEEGVPGVVAAFRYYIARAQAEVVGPGRECPICGWSGRDFIPLLLLRDHYVRRGAVCPGCHSRERQRAFIPALRDLLSAELGDRKVDILEFSPDAQVALVLRDFASSYRASNYENPAPGELQLDLHDLALADQSVDLVVMTYVLCCVPDDLTASRNLWRVLRPGGMVVACEAFAPSGVHDEWGAAGHGGTWRQYGATDVRTRFAPFDVELIDATGALPVEQRVRRGLRHPEYVLVLRKPSHRT